MSDVQDLYRMYRDRDFELITVSANMPDEKNSVLKMLQNKHASTRNLLFGTDDTQGLQTAFNPKWQSGVPYTVLIAPDGTIVYEKEGDLDMLHLRRTILANLTADYVGFQNYWKLQQ
jgi:hypothetical protein